MKLLFSVILFLQMSLVAYAQDSTRTKSAFKPTPPHSRVNIREKIFWGGNVGASFGSFTYINLSPLVGYKITEDFSMGLGITYNYYSQPYGTGKLTYTIYGVNTFARYFVLPNLFAQVGWDRLSILDDRSFIKNKRVWIDNILIGGGFRQAVSRNAYFIMAGFYNINQTPLSPYPNPIIQLGFAVGL